jgi:hypothetical protein
MTANGRSIEQLVEELLALCHLRRLHPFDASLGRQEIRLRYELRELGFSERELGVSRRQLGTNPRALRVARRRRASPGLTR